MSRSFHDRLKEFETAPHNWELISAHTEFATRKGARRFGLSTQTIYRQRLTGDILVRHLVTDDRGGIVDDHFRPEYKPRRDELDE